MIAVIGATLARTIQDFVSKGDKRDAMVSLSGVSVIA
jgi:hypothetical protein